ncbi:MAG: hypothetical protein ABSA51_07490 [Anaerolineaceae bacterium]|jgi:hypothetical protein
MKSNQLFKMTQGGEMIEVHPSVVAAHQRLGWELVDPLTAEDIAIVLQKADYEAAATQSSKDSKLVKMAKSGAVHQVNAKESVQDPDEVIEVASSAVEAHLRIGWRVIDEDWLKRFREDYLIKHPICEDPFHRHGGAEVKAVIVEEIPELYRNTRSKQWFYFWALCDSCSKY